MKRKGVCLKHANLSHTISERHTQCRARARRITAQCMWENVVHGVQQSAFRITLETNQTARRCLQISVRMEPSLAGLCSSNKREISVSIRVEHEYLWASSNVCGGNKEIPGSFPTIRGHILVFYLQCLFKHAARIKLPPLQKPVQK